MALVSALLYFVWQVDNIDDFDACEVAGDTVNVYSDSDVQGALVTGDDIAVKVIGNHKIVLLKNPKTMHQMQGSLLTWRNWNFC